jgi:hypothetical protein
MAAALASTISPLGQPRGLTQRAVASIQYPQVDGYLVAGPQDTEVTAHPGLVGNDEGVPCVGLALAAVGG